MLLGFAQSKAILWVGLVLFSIGKRVFEKKDFSMLKSFSVKHCNQCHK
jgi:hypothetical protein